MLEWKYHPMDENATSKKIIKKCRIILTALREFEFVHSMRIMEDSEYGNLSIDLELDSFILSVNFFRTKAYLESGDVVRGAFTLGVANEQVESGNN